MCDMKAVQSLALSLACSSVHQSSLVDTVHQTITCVDQVTCCNVLCKVERPKCSWLTSKLTWGNLSCQSNTCNDLLQSIRTAELSTVNFLICNLCKAVY